MVPGRVCCQIALTGSHLMDAACNELVQAHEGVGGEAGWVGIVLRGREICSPSFQEFLLDSPSEGRICSGNQGGGGYVCARRGGNISKNSSFPPIPHEACEG